MQVRMGVWPKRNLEWRLDGPERACKALDSSDLDWEKALYGLWK